ncbi:MAG: MATE family efflux transporter [Clostridia bacterium]|nr:MATE family efflux transporter [Clostridia bacterium]
MAKKYEMDFTEGSILKKMIICALPIIGVNILQLLFTAADVAVLGIFTNDHAVAAVGSTTQITNMLIGFFVGLSVGANILVARATGAKDPERAKRLVGTSVVASVIFGTVVMIAGILLTEKLLIWTNCDEKVFPYAAKYLKIYFIGMPVIMLYNFCASILRAVGDTVRPLIFLVIGGVLNIGLNIFFIIAVGLDVEGVAIATVVSQAVSAVGALIIMARSSGYSALDKKEVRIRKKEIRDIFFVGLPLGLSKCTFAVANVVILSSLNSLGDQIMAANAIVKEFDAIILEVMHGLTIASIAMISQNLGAKKPERIKRTILTNLAVVICVGVALGAIFYVTAPFLCGIMTNTEAVIEYGMIRVVLVGVPYVLCGIVNVLQEGIRGLGYSNTSLGISVFSNIVFRVFWLTAIYPLLYSDNISRNYAYICMVWPLSWIVIIVLATPLLIFFYRKTKKKIQAELAALA